MKDDKTLQQFIELRASGVPFDRIAQQLGVSKPTLIQWSRCHQHLIQNLRTIEWETFVDGLLASRQERLRAISERLGRLEAELARRDLASVPTDRLHTMAESLRRRLDREVGTLTFTSPLDGVPAAEIHDEVQDWIP